MNDSRSHVALVARRNSLSRAPRAGMLRDSEPLGCGLGPVPSAPGISGPGDDQRGLCVLAGAARLGRRWLLARDRNLAYIASHHGCRRSSSERGLHVRVWAEPEDVAESVTRCVATGVAGLSIEDATGDSSSPLYDAAHRGRTRPRRARSDRSIRLRRAAHREG